MEENARIIESILTSASEYAKSGFELTKLKALDKTTDIISSVVPHSLVILLVLTFIFFLNIGIALWLGEILGKVFFGFFIVAAFYGLSGVVIHYFAHEKIKRFVGDYFIKCMLK
jgi:hypothetical protein